MVGGDHPCCFFHLKGVFLEDALYEIIDAGIKRGPRQCHAAQA